MTTFAEILKKSKEIKELVEICQYTNPRLFKSFVKDERGYLNILVDPNGDTTDGDSSLNDMDTLRACLEQELEGRLKCSVSVVCNKDLNDEYRDRVMTEAISLDESEKLLQYYGQDFQFNPYSTTYQADVFVEYRATILAPLVEKRNKAKEGSSITTSELKRKRNEESVNDTTSHSHAYFNSNDTKKPKFTSNVDSDSERHSLHLITNDQVLGRC